MRQVGLLVLGLAVVIVPDLAAAAVVVADPTGGADPAFLAELKASLETVAAEAPAELDAELRSSAELTVAGVELVVELVPSDGKQPIRESRTASRASASAQARAMARAALKALMSSSSAATEPKAQAPVVAATVPQPEEVTPPPELEPEPLPKPEPPPPPPLPEPPLPEKYSRRTALRYSLWTTVFGVVVGGGMSTSAAAIPAVGISGVAVASLGLVLGPSVGYFWIGRTSHAWGMAGFRLAALGVGITFMTLYVKTFQWGDGDIEQKSNPGFLALSIIGITTGLVAAFVDAGLVGRAADRVNEQWRKDLSATGASRRTLQVAVAPVMLSNGNGDGTFGLAVSGTF